MLAVFQLWSPPARSLQVAVSLQELFRHQSSTSDMAMLSRLMNQSAVVSVSRRTDGSDTQKLSRAQLKPSPRISARLPTESNAATAPRLRGENPLLRATAEPVAVRTPQRRLSRSSLKPSGRKDGSTPAVASPRAAWNPLLVTRTVADV